MISGVLYERGFEEKMLTSSTSRDREDVLLMYNVGDSWLERIVDDEYQNIFEIPRRQFKILRKLLPIGVDFKVYVYEIKERAILFKGVSVLYKLELTYKDYHMFIFAVR